MKKVLCVILSITLLFSSLGVLASAAAEGNTNTGFDFNLSDLVKDNVNEEGFKNALQDYTFNENDIPDEFKNEGKYDMEKLIQSGTADKVYMFGLSLDFMYNSDEKLFWSKLPSGDSFYCPACQKTYKADKVPDRLCPECGAALKNETIYNDMALACGNLNLFFKNLLNNHYSGKDLLTAENATKICNIIGHLFFPDYVDQEIGFTIPLAEDNADEFYNAIAEKSGLANLIQLNWCNNYNLNIKPLLYTLGVNFENFPVLERDIRDGKIVARILLKAIVNAILNQGPVNYLLDVIWAFSRTYSVYLYEPVKEIFKLKIARNMISEEELKTIKGLLNLIFNDNDPSNTEKLQFITPPTRRFAYAESKTELFLYVIIYLNLVGKNGSNPTVVEKMKADINSNTMLTDTEKSRLSTIIGGLFCGQLNEMVPMLANVFIDNISDIKTSMWQSFVKLIKNFIHNIVAAFDKVYQNLKNFGNWGKA